MKRLIDTNVLVYCYDQRYPTKQRVARDLLWHRAGDESLLLAHQVLVEFISAVTRPRRELGGMPILTPETAHREVDELLTAYPVMFPDEQTLVTAMRGHLAYGLSWYDAHLWAYAEVNGVDEILSEDFEHGRHYGSVRVVDPFLVASDSIHELPPMYDDEVSP